MITTTAIALAILAAPSPAEAGTVEPGRRCPKLAENLERFVEAKLRERFKNSGAPRIIARALAPRIVAEARRHKVDPIAMTAIAWIESDFNPYARGAFGGVGRRRNEVGVWQLIPGDAPVVAAAKAISGCKPGALFAPWLRATWARNYRGGPCEAPDVGALRRRPGAFGRAELADFTIGTWVAAREIASHVAKCRTRHPLRHGPARPWLAAWRKRNPKAIPIELERYSHYNFGSRWLAPRVYTFRVFRRYERIKRAVCKADANS